MKLRIGLVGLGDQWESRHAKALRALSDRFEVAAVCCEVFAKAQQVAKQFDAAAIHSFRSLIRREDIDAILYLSPQWYGSLPILEACEHGKAVYSSAALDVTPDQALDLRTRIECSGIAYMAELPRRHAPATIRLKELIATRLGKPHLLFCHERMPAESQADWRRRGPHCPLVWRNLMELVDWCRYLVADNPVSVISSIHDRHDSQKDLFYQMVNLEFPRTEGLETRPMAQLSIGHYIPGQWSDALSFRRPPSIQVCCEKGMAFIDLPSNLVWFDDAGQHNESLESERAVGEQMLDRFYRAVTSFLRRTTDPDDAYRAMQIVVKAHQSAKTGNRELIEW